MTKYADRLLFTALMLLAFAGVQAAGTPRKTTSLRSDANPQAMVVLHPKTMKYHCEGVKVRYAVTGGIRMTQQEALAKGAVPTKLFGVPTYCK